MPTRPFSSMRAVKVQPNFLSHPEGSVLIAYGQTQVICTASIEERVPPWLVGKGSGWVTAEYDMLPRATSNRRPRDAHRGKINGRTQEISRLIGRSLRSAVDLKALGERTITIDCDVIQADGGTRTAAITGGFVALSLAIEHLRKDKKLKASPLTGQIAAVSVGIVDGHPVVDLDYNMDSNAHVDMNIVMNSHKQLVEVQGTAEGATFSRDELNNMLDLAFGVLPDLVVLQQQACQQLPSARNSSDTGAHVA